MTLNPYQELNLDPTASAADVKRAYRKRAKQTHPDSSSPDREAFERATRANIVLSDPAKRSRYDQTGTIDETVDNALANAVSLIIGFISAAVVSHVGGGPDPCTRDLVKEARNSFKQNIHGFENQKVQINKAIKSLTKVIGKLKSKKDNPLLREALKHQLASTSQPLGQLDRNIQQYRDAIALLDTYWFEADPAAPATGLSLSDLIRAQTPPWATGT